MVSRKTIINILKKAHIPLKWLVKQNDLVIKKLYKTNRRITKLRLGTKKKQKGKQKPKGKKKPNGTKKKPKGKKKVGDILTKTIVKNVFKMDTGGTSIQWSKNDQNDFLVKNRLRTNVLNKSLPTDFLLFKLNIEKLKIDDSDKIARGTLKQVFKVPSKWFTTTGNTHTKEPIIFAMMSEILMWLYTAFTKFLNDSFKNETKIFIVNLFKNNVDLILIRPSIPDNEFINKLNVEQTFKNGLFNCVVKAIKKQCKKMDKQKIKKINDIYFKSGVTCADFKDISKIVKCNFNLTNIIGTTKYEYIKNKKYKTVKICNSEYNHVSDCKHSLFSAVSKKELIKVDDKELFDMFNNETNIKYNPAKIIKPDHLIFNDVVYHTEDYLYKKGLFEYVFSQFNKSDYLYKNKDEELFNFSMSSIHSLGFIGNDEYNGNETVSVDKNKAYGSFSYSKYYEKFKFPSGLDGVYKNKNLICADKIINKNGISKIYNIKYDKCNDNIIKQFEKINFLVEMEIYPNNFLYYVWHDLKIRFTIDAVATSHNFIDLDFNEEICNNGIHKLCYGIFQMSKDYKNYNIHGDKKTLEIIQDDLMKCEGYTTHLGYNEVETNKQLYNINPLDYGIRNIVEEQTKEITPEQKTPQKKPNTLTVIKEINTVSNLSYISSYMIGYNLINILEKIKNVEYNEIKKIYCDNIVLDKKYKKLFELDDNDMSKWKIHHNNIDLDMGNTDKYLRYENKLTVRTPYILTEDKLKYGQFNLITGGAGVGKSTRFFQKFKEDERITNCMFLFPTHDLKAVFEERYNIKNTNTYQAFISKSSILRIHSKNIFKNIILDETTFLNKKEFNLMISIAKTYNYNVFFIGDLDKERIYQLASPNGESATYEDYEPVITYHKHLIKVHRNSGELLNRLNKIRDEDLSNYEIKKLFSDRMIEKDDVFKHYKVSLENQILCPINKVVAEYNKYFFENNNNVIQKDPKTNHHKKEINNKRRIVAKEDYRYKSYLTSDTSINKHLGYSITAHLSQGKTYNKRVFIDPSGIYTKNLMYVMLSRATCLDNIYIVRTKTEFKKKKLSK